MNKEYAQEMLQKLNDLEADGKFRGKIYVFGHSGISGYLIDLLIERGLKVWGIMDNNPAKWGVSYRGISVNSPQEHLMPVKKDAEILIASHNYHSMKRQLTEMGYAGHIHRMVNFNTFAEYSLDEKTFTEKAARVRKGISLLEQIRIKCSQEFLVVCPYITLGDIYIALMYLPKYLSKHNISDYVLILFGNGCFQTAQLFDIPKIEVLSRYDVEALIQALIFTDDPNSIIVGNYTYTNWNTRFSNYNSFSMEQHVKVSVFGLDIDTKAVLPPHRQYAGTFPFPKNKTVLIAPYAKTLTALPDAFWKELVRKLIEQGYTVLTNISGSEKALPGTNPLSLKISDTIAAAEWAGTFIGFRSGLCDVMRRAICKKIILYPNCIHGTTNNTIFEFFEIIEQDTKNIVFSDLDTTVAKVLNLISENDSFTC